MCNDSDAIIFRVQLRDDLIPNNAHHKSFHFHLSMTRLGSLGCFTVDITLSLLGRVRGMLFNKKYIVKGQLCTYIGLEVPKKLLEQLYSQLLGCCASETWSLPVETTERKD